MTVLPGCFRLASSKPLNINVVVLPPATRDLARLVPTQSRKPSRDYFRQVERVINDRINARSRMFPKLSETDVDDPELRQVIERAAVTKSPPQAWYRTMGNNPEVAKAFANYWDMLHRGGSVPHEIKELARIQIAQMIGCEFCARQTSPLAASITEEEKTSCALPNWEHPDPKTRAALHYARTLTLDDGRDAQVYEELKEISTATRKLSSCPHFFV